MSLLHFSQLLPFTQHDTTVQTQNAHAGDQTNTHILLPISRNIFPYQHYLITLRKIDYTLFLAMASFHL